MVLLPCRNLFIYSQKIKWEKTLANNIPDKGLIFMVYEECPQIDIKTHDSTEK